MGAITFVVAISGVAMLQFFLQFTLDGRWTRQDFWTYGLAISCLLGSALGLPLAVMAGIAGGIMTWLKNKYPEKKPEES